MERCKEYDRSKLPQARLYDLVFRDFEDCGDPDIRDAWQHCLRDTLHGLLGVPLEQVDWATAQPGRVLVSGIPGEHLSYWNWLCAKESCVVEFVPSAVLEPSPYNRRVETELMVQNSLPKCPRCASRLMDMTEKTIFGKPVRKACCAICNLHWRLK